MVKDLNPDPQTRRRSNPYGGGYGHYEEEEGMYERRGGPPKRRWVGRE